MYCYSNVRTIMEYLKKKKTVGYGTEYSALYWIYGIYVQVLDCKIRISSLFLIWLMLEDSAGKVFAD